MKLLIFDAYDLIFMLVLGVSMGFFAGHYVAKSAERSAALRAGAAHWEADPASGEAKFVYHKGKP